MRIVLRICVALFSVVAAPLYAQDVRSTALAVGSGSGQIGLVKVPNEECRGPATVTPTNDARLALLDQVNQKVVLVGGRNVEEIPLPGDLLDATDIAAITQGYLVAGALGDVVVIDRNGVILARTQVPHNHETGTVRIVFTMAGFALEELSGNRLPINMDRTQIGDLDVPGLATAESYMQTNSSVNQVTIGTNARRSHGRATGEFKKWLDERASGECGLSVPRSSPAR